MFRRTKTIIALLLLFSFVSCMKDSANTTTESNETTIGSMFNDIIEQVINTDNQYEYQSDFDINTVPDYKNQAYIEINNNKPFFKSEELTTESFEHYSELDSLGRCGVAYACLSKDTMPAENEERGSIGMIKPAGWHTVKYPEVIDDLYLYNRCHLIGWQLCAENANKLNLTTGTRYMNVEGMLPFENMVDDYIENTGNHVMYRVTPVFVDDELVCRGVLIEAQSVEDNGCVFNVFCYNVQPGIAINYKTGESGEIGIIDNATENETEPTKYILNNGSKKVHREDCKYAAEISERNYEEYYGTLYELIENGFSACGSCKPE